MGNSFKFKIKCDGFDNRRNYSINRIVKSKSHLGGYMVILNETSRPISLGWLMESFVNKYRK
jgi:hypothetical protein